MHVVVVVVVVVVTLEFVELGTTETYVVDPVVKVPTSLLATIALAKIVK